MQPSEHRLLAVAALCVALALSPAVHAQSSNATGTAETTPPARDSTAPAPTSFEELDANGDNAIGKDEAAVDPALAQAFGTLDKDADGKLSPAEYAAYDTAGGG